MKRILLLCSVILLFTTTALAQKDQKEKPWTEWGQKEALKVLTDSAWSQTQTELTDSSSSSSGSAITKTESRNAATMSMGDNAKSGESAETLGKQNASLSLKYYVAFLTAKPVRAAFIRMIELQQPETPAEKVTERRAFVDRDFGDLIVVGLKLDGTDRKRLGPMNQSLSGSNLDTLKDVVYLERKDGKRVALKDYRAPGPDGMGAKFIFPRTLDGKPFLDANSGEVRVYMEIGKTKLNRKFKVADMMYDGKLEY
jgi:hypothetical protein